VELSKQKKKNGLCISLGANIDSKFGSPLESLLMCKPKIEEIKDLIVMLLVMNMNFLKKYLLFKNF